MGNFDFNSKCTQKTMNKGLVTGGIKQDEKY